MACDFASDFLERVVNAQWAFKKGDVATPRRLPESRQISLTNRFHVAVQSLVIMYHLNLFIYLFCVLLSRHSALVWDFKGFVFLNYRTHDWGFNAV